MDQAHHTHNFYPREDTTRCDRLKVRERRGGRANEAVSSRTLGSILYPHARMLHKALSGNHLGPNQLVVVKFEKAQYGGIADIQKSSGRSRTTMSNFVEVARSKLGGKGHAKIVANECRT